MPDDHVDFSYEDAMDLEFTVVPAALTYQRNNDQGTWTDMSKDTDFMKERVAEGIKLKIVGIVKTREDANSAMLSEGVAYPKELTYHLMKLAADSQIVQEQLAHRDTDVFTGKSFDELQDGQNNDFDFENIFSVDEDALRKAFSFDTSALKDMGDMKLDLSGVEMDPNAMQADPSNMQLDTSALSSAFNEDTMKKIMAGAPKFEFTPAAPATPQQQEATQPQDNGSSSSSSSDDASSSSTAADSDDASSSSSASESEDSSGSSAADESGSTSDDASSSSSDDTDGESGSTSDDEAGNAQLQAPQVPQVPINLTPEQQAQITEAGNEVASGYMAWLAKERPEAVASMFAGDPVDTGTLFQEYLQANPDAAQTIATMGQSVSESVQQSVEDQINAATQDYMVNKLAPYMSAQMEAIMTQAAQAMATQMAQAMAAQMTEATKSYGTALSQAISGQLGDKFKGLSKALKNGFSVDAEAFANAIQFNMTQDDLTSLLTNYMNADELSYDANLTKLGYATKANPDSISIYSKDFPAKEAVLDIIDGYNDRVTVDGDDTESIQYSDIAGVLMSSVTDIVDTISLVLIAFVSISLVVSSIMIAIVTYISVLERKKEIGVLRAMGASRGNIANVFNAETVIEGFISGVLAIAVVLAVSIPVNAIVLETQDVPNVMQLPWDAALVLIGISVLLTFVAGLIPSQKAAHADPVEALRSE